MILKLNIESFGSTPKSSQCLINSDAVIDVKSRGTASSQIRYNLDPEDRLNPTIYLNMVESPDFIQAQSNTLQTFKNVSFSYFPTKGSQVTDTIYLNTKYLAYAEPYGSSDEYTLLTYNNAGRFSTSVLINATLDEVFGLVDNTASSTIPLMDELDVVLGNKDDYSSFIVEFNVTQGNDVMGKEIFAYLDDGEPDAYILNPITGDYIDGFEISSYLNGDDIVLTFENSTGSDMTIRYIIKPFLV